MGHGRFDGWRDRAGFVLTDADFRKIKDSTTEGQIAHHSAKITPPLYEKPPPQAYFFIQIFHAEGAKWLSVATGFS